MLDFSCIGVIEFTIQITASAMCLSETVPGAAFMMCFILAYTRCLYLLYYGNTLFKMDHSCGLIIQHSCHHVRFPLCSENLNIL